MWSFLISSLRIVQGPKLKLFCFIFRFAADPPTDRPIDYPSLLSHWSRYFRNEPAETLNADGQLVSASCPMLLRTTLATSNISAAAASMAAVPTAASASAPLAARDASGSGFACEGGVLSDHVAGRIRKKVDWAAAACLKRKNRRDEMRSEARTKDKDRRRTKARLMEAGALICLGPRKSCMCSASRLVSGGAFTTVVCVFLCFCFISRVLLAVPIPWRSTACG